MAALFVKLSQFWWGLVLAFSSEVAAKDIRLYKSQEDTDVAAKELMILKWKQKG